MATNMEKAAELLQKEDFVVKVSEAADQNAAIAIFKENGVEARRHPGLYRSILAKYGGAD